MSALEKALRQIDDQREHAPRPQAAPTMMALPSEPLLVHALLRWLPGLALLLLTAAAAGGGYWVYRTGGVQAAWGERAEAPATGTAVPAATPAPPSANPPMVAPAPALTAPPVAAAATPANAAEPARAGQPVFERPKGFDQAVLAWTSGQHAPAAQLWLDALRRLPPSTMALLLAEPQTPEQVNNAVLAQAAALPWLVLPGAADGAERWTVLVLTPAAELDRTHAWLARAGQAPLQWGTVAHWVARSEAEATSRARPAAPSPAVPTRVPPAAVKAAPVPPVGANRSVAPPAARPPVAPAASTASTAAVPTAGPSVAAVPAKTAAGAAPTRGATAAAATPPTPAPGAEATQLSRSAASETSTTTDNGVPSAARSIESEFAAVEQDLAAARYDAALRRVGQLETNIGPNWRTRYLTGVALSGLQRWQEALSMLTQARQGNTAHTRLALYLSVAQQELGQHDAAIETLNRALDSQSDMPELWLNKAHSLQALSRGEEAAFHYRRFLELSRNRQDLSQQRAWVQKLLDQKASAW